MAPRGWPFSLRDVLPAGSAGPRRFGQLVEWWLVAARGHAAVENSSL